MSVAQTVGVAASLEADAFMNQVSSRGCSRAYILCVLFRALKYVRLRRMSGQPVSFPFQVAEIESWLISAKTDCLDIEFQRVFGGTDFCLYDSSTFWTSAAHFFTWWKNNIERKNKFLSLLVDSDYGGDDEKGQTRARFCKQAIALSINIKNHFERVLNQQVDRSVLTQIVLPFSMPAHLERDFQTVGSCASCEVSRSLTPTLDPEPEAGAAAVSDSPITLGICSRCVHLIEYAEYLAQVLTGKLGKAGKRRQRVDYGGGKGRKKPRCDDSYVPSGKARAVGAHAVRTSARPPRRLLPATIPDDCCAGSELLLGMKKSRVDTAGFACDDTGSSDTSLAQRRETSGSFVDSDSDAAFGAGHDFLGPTENTGVIGTEEHCAASRGSGVHSHYQPGISFFPPTRGDTPELYLRSLESPGGDAMYAHASAHSSTATEGVNLDDGRSLHEFLVACYRDGIYPSPAAAGKHQGANFSATHDLTSPTEQAGGDGNCDPCTSGVQSRDGQEGDRVGIVAGPASTSCAEESDCAASAAEPSTQSAHCAHSSSSSTMGDAFHMNGPPGFAYEELQLLLSQLLQDPPPSLPALPPPAGEDCTATEQTEGDAF